jgi:histidine ammonia-lyase
VKQSGPVVVLTGDALTLEDVVAVARGHARVKLAPAAVEAMRRTRAVVERALERGDSVYGLTTGVGVKKAARVEPAAAVAWNALLLRNHLVGQGPALPGDVARAALVRLANGLAGATAGARPELAQALVNALNDGAEPRVRRYGSVGMSDLSANADLLVNLVGDFELAPGEGVALLNHNAVSTGYAALALADAETLLDALDVRAALDLEAFAANADALDPAVAEVRPYPGLRVALGRVRAALAGSPLLDAASARNLQDPLAFRCIPQIHGAARDALAFASGQLAIELNASQVNPLVRPEPERIVSVGNFDPLPLAAALDFLRIALAPVLTSAGERAVKLLQRPQSGLPEGLASKPGLPDDGLAEFGLSVQAIVAEARLLAQPVSFTLVSTSQAEGIEDRATLAPLAARRLAEQVELGARTAAIGLVVAAQAVDLRRPPALGAGAAKAYALVREHVAAIGAGDVVPPDLEPVVELVRSGAVG